MTNMILSLSLIALSSQVFAGSSDPNLSYEGNKVIVKRAACLRYGGQVGTDRRYFICEGGRYDGYITVGPQTVFDCNNQNLGRACWIHYNDGGSDLGRCVKIDDTPSCELTR